MTLDRNLGSLWWQLGGYAAILHSEMQKAASYKNKSTLERAVEPEGNAVRFFNHDFPLGISV